ncbi:MAG: hypothetical protein HEEMFOPI_00011 [Holosporales bacterium]
MSIIPMNILPINLIDTSENHTLKNQSPSDINNPDDLLKTYLHTLKILKTTNDMLISEKKILIQELNEYKKRDMEKERAKQQAALNESNPTNQ